MRVQVFPVGDRWEVAFPDPSEAELAAVGISKDDLGLERDHDFATSGEARRAAKKVVRGMHRLTETVEIELLEERPPDA